MFGRPNFFEDVYGIYPTKGTKAFQGFEVNKVLFEGKSPYQDVAIYANDTLGRVLVLDGIVQITEMDEFIYQEMMAHVPLFANGKAENVLIIGGGDGGILREVLRHKTVKKAVMAEIDQMVIDACVEHMPSINQGGNVYTNPRAELIVGDAFKYVAETDVKFDAVIIDSTDPIGPGEKLFTPEFYGNLAKILNDGACVSTQGGVPIFQPGEVAGTIACLNGAGLKASCYHAAVPTYYGGYMTLGYGVKAQSGQQPDLATLQNRYAAAGFNTRHYSPEMHLASFVLPPWIAKDAGLDQSQHEKKEAA